MYAFTACFHGSVQDVSPQEEEEEELALEIITYIGLSISIIALMLTITTYLLSKYSHMSYS